MRDCRLWHCRHQLRWPVGLKEVGWLWGGKHAVSNGVHDSEPSTAISDALRPGPRCVVEDDGVTSSGRPVMATGPEELLVCWCSCGCVTIGASGCRLSLSSSARRTGVCDWLAWLPTSWGDGAGLGGLNCDISPAIWLICWAWFRCWCNESRRWRPGRPAIAAVACCWVDWGSISRPSFPLLVRAAGETHSRSVLASIYGVS